MPVYGSKYIRASSPYYSSIPINSYNSSYNLYESQRMLSQYAPVKKRELYFIYGTLKSGHRNHYLLPSDKKLLGQYVLEQYNLYEVANGIPGAVENPGGRITGEVWEVGKNCIQVMQVLEEGYTLRKVYIKDAYNGKELLANIWTWNNDINNRRFLGHYEWNIEMENESYMRGLTIQ